MTGEIDNDTLFEMANLFPADTGLPMVIWASERGRARHDVRIKVNQSHGTRMLRAISLRLRCGRRPGWLPGNCRLPICSSSASGSR
jgi:hypothetical protein